MYIYIHCIYYCNIYYGYGFIPPNGKIDVCTSVRPSRRAASMRSCVPRRMTIPIGSMYGIYKSLVFSHQMG